MTRRELLLAAASSAITYAESGAWQLSVEAYIFQQYAERQKKTLREVLPEVIPMAKEAGFRNIELNGQFFEPACRSKTLSLIRANKLQMPSVYSGGVLHNPEKAAETIEHAVAIARLCKPFGCRAVVCNADPKGEGIEKTDAELAAQAEQMNRMGQTLQKAGFELRMHNHTPEMLSNAREWRYTLLHTDPQFVSLCIDLDWVQQGGQDPLGLLKEAGQRVTEIHVRNSKNKIWLEDVEDGDVDYSAIAAYLREAKLRPLIVAELAYRPQTKVTRTLEKDLQLSRIYTEKIFGINA